MSDHVLAILGDIFGLLGIALALVTLTPMLWGKPKVSIDFRTDVEQETRLLIDLRNRSVTNRVLLAFGVIRTTADITGDYRVEDGNGKEVESGPLAFEYRYDDWSRHISLAGEKTAYITAVKKDYDRDYATLGRWEEDADTIQLENGNYRFQIDLTISGRSISTSRWFLFTDRHLAWMDH